MNIGGGGLGYKERPGLGSDTSVSMHLLVLVLVLLCCVLTLCVCLQDRSGSSTVYSSISSSSGSLEGYSKPPAGALGDRMSAMKQAFQVHIEHFTMQSYLSRVRLTFQVPSPHTDTQLCILD